MIKDKFFSMRMTSEMLDALKIEAAKNNRTVAGQILHYIKQGLETAWLAIGLWNFATIAKKKESQKTGCL